MEKKGVQKSCFIVSGARDDSLCAMYFGVSCAFFALKALSEQTLDDQKCIDIRDKMLQGSAHLLGLLVWRVQKADVESIEKCQLLHKLEAAERELRELKRTRSEDAKANEKVASIYAAQEQSWFAERRQLRQQVGSLMNDLRILDRRKNEGISELNGRLQEMEFSVKSKDRMLEEVEKKRKDLEEKVSSVEAALEELREATNREAEEHSSELLKHKTAFIELVSNHRQLEAELSRALRQVEVTKEQLDFVFEEKEEAVLIVQEISMEHEKMLKESEQKDKILSAMMRKSKLDSVERQLLLKEVKSSKSKRKKAEKEVERSRTIPRSRNEKRTLRNMLSRQVSSRFEFFPAEREGDSIAMGLPEVDIITSEHDNTVFGDLGNEVRKEHDDYPLHLEQIFSDKCAEFDEAKRLDEWVHLEAEKYHNAFEQRHQLELDAFSEQMQLKDDKLEAYRWRLLNAELESKRLKSQIEGLNQDMTQLRHDNFKLETLLLDREVELKTLKDQFALQLKNLSVQKTMLQQSRCDLLQPSDPVWSKVKLIKKKPADKEQVKKNSVGAEAKKEEEPGSSSIYTSSTSLSSSSEGVEEKEVLGQSRPACIELSSPEGFESNNKEEAVKLSSNKKDTSTWKVDLHALGVSYKIKRLNQQLLMLDRLAGSQESSENKERDEHARTRMKGFCLLLSLLNKQVSRYQSLQEKTDDLSKRMGEKDLNLKRGVSYSKRTTDETKTLEHFLEETFQLQRYIVATGQKLIEIQSKIASGFVGIANDLEVSANFDMKRFADTIQSLFKDVQRGLEVRISRIMGDLGGTLTCDGIHFRK